MVDEFPVTNPALLLDLGYDFSIYFISSKETMKCFEQLPKLNVEIYQVLGRCEYICKFFSKNKSLHGLLNEHQLYSPNIIRYSVSSLSRYAFRSNFEYVNVQNIGKKTSKLLVNLQSKWSKISQNAKDELIDANLVFEQYTNPKNISSHKITKLFTLISLPSRDKAKNYKDVFREQLLDNFRNEIEGIYWGQPYESSQCLIEITASDIWKALDLVSMELHKVAEPGIKTESFLCTTALHSAIDNGITSEDYENILFPSPRVNKKLYGLQADINEIFTLFEQYSYEINIEDVDELNQIECAIHYQKIKMYLKQLKTIKFPGCENRNNDFYRHMIMMMYGIINSDAENIGRAALIISPLIEVLSRRLLSTYAFMIINDKPKIMQLFNLNTLKKSVFPDGLNAKETQDKIKIWNESYPEHIFLSNNMVDLWDLVRNIRNNAGHGHGHVLNSSLAHVKEYGPRVFQILEKLIVSWNELPHELKFDF